MEGMAPKKQSSSSRHSLPPHLVDCIWWKKGYCFRGTECYFRHDQALAGTEKETTKAPPANTEKPSEATSSSTNAPASSQGPEPCAICLEVPVTYGLLLNCDHVFCLGCIRSWRSSSNNSGNDEHGFLPPDQSDLARVTKACPLCRKQSDFVIPSSVFPTPPSSSKGTSSTENGGNVNAEGTIQDTEKNAAKEKITKRYLDKLKELPCRYFEEGVKRWRQAVAQAQAANPGSEPTIPEFQPRCYFANECHYAHTNPITKGPYIFSPEEVVSMDQKRKGRQARQRRGQIPGDGPQLVGMIDGIEQFRIEAEDLYAQFLGDALPGRAVFDGNGGEFVAMPVRVEAFISSPQSVMVDVSGAFPYSDSDEDDYTDSDEDMPPLSEF